MKNPSRYRSWPRGSRSYRLVTKWVTTPWGFIHTTDHFPKTKYRCNQCILVQRRSVQASEVLSSLAQYLFMRSQLTTGKIAFTSQRGPLLGIDDRSTHHLRLEMSAPTADSVTLLLAPLPPLRQAAICIYACGDHKCCREVPEFVSTLGS